MQASAALLLTAGCSAVGFSTSASTTTVLGATNNSLNAVTASTKKNQSVSFNAGTFASGALQGQRVGKLRLDTAGASSSIATGNGTFTLVNPSTYLVAYTPNESYVGTDTLTVYATDENGNVASGQITVNIGNSLNSIQPALAVRGMSCITCHSNVSSNIVTDYGAGNPWYFDTTSSDSFYFDRQGATNGLSTLSLLNSSKIIVPAVAAPASIQSQYSISSLADFVKARFAQGGPNLASQVQEIPSLQITIPTTARIKTLFGNPSTSQVFIPDTQYSPALQGLVYDQANNVFKITNLICDGDLYLDSAAVVFDAAKIQSLNGCRIYATGTVFITSAPVVSMSYNGSSNYNTQILSTQSIWLGSGRIVKNGSFCERDSSGNTTGWYKYSSDTGGVDCTSSAGASSIYCDSQGTRSNAFQGRNTFSRAYASSSALASLLKSPYNGSASGTVDQARASVEASLGHPLYDASCESAGRSVAISRLMLVSPYVSNRYSGAFTGSTIAEAALMSLGTFTYTFDPVFTKVSIFSMLDNGELISGQGI